MNSRKSTANVGPRRPTAISISRMIETLMRYRSLGFDKAQCLTLNFIDNVKLHNPKHQLALLPREGQVEGRWFGFAMLRLCEYADRFVA